MALVYIFFADGVEEIEALTAVDILRRGGVETVMVSVTGNRTIHGSHDIIFETDRLFEDGPLTDADMLVLPGGGAGTKALTAHEGLRELLFAYAKKDRWIGAICAAPSVLGRNGLLRGRRATCFPGFEEFLEGATVTGESVVVDGKFITGKGMGVANEFALSLLGALDADKAAEVRAKIQMP